MNKSRMSNKSIYQQIKSALEQSPERPFEEDMWVDMQSRIEEDKEQRKLPFWLFVGFLLLLIFAVFILFSSEKTKNSTNEKVALEYEKEEKSISTISDNNQKEIQISAKEKNKLVIGNDSKNINTKIAKRTNNVNTKELHNSNVERFQVADIELVESGKIDIKHKIGKLIPDNNDGDLVLRKLQYKELMPLLSLPLKRIEKKQNTEERIADVYIVPLSSNKHKKHQIQLGIFTGKTYSYLRLPALTLTPEETKSSKIHFGLSTLLKLNKNFKIGLHLHYKDEMYSRFTNWDNIPNTQTHFVSKTDSTPKQLGVGLNLTFFPLKARAISPYLGLGIQQDLKLQEKRTYYFSPSIYNTELSEYTETKTIKGELLRTRTTVVKLGTEVSLSSRIQFFGECLRHLPLEKEINVSSYKWSWRAGILFNL